MNKEVKKLTKTLRKQGFDIDESGRHLKITRQGYAGSVTLSRTPSDHRGIKNMVGILRRDFDFKQQGR